MKHDLTKKCKNKQSYANQCKRLERRTVSIAIVAILFVMISQYCKASKEIEINNNLSYAENERDKVINKLEDAVVALYLAQGQKKKVDFNWARDRDKVNYIYDDTYGWCLNLEYPNNERDIILATACPSRNYYSIDNKPLANIMFNNNLNLEQFSNDKGVIWQEAEEYLKLFYANEKYVLKRNAIYNHTKMTKVAVWDIYLDGYNCENDKAIMYLFHLKGINMIILNFPSYTKRKEKVTSEMAEKKAKNMADWILLTRPNYKTVIYTNESYLKRTSMIHGEKQPVYKDSINNSKLRLMYKISILVFDKKSKSIKVDGTKQMWKEVKGNITYYVDAETGRLFTEEIYID